MKKIGILRFDDLGPIAQEAFLSLNEKQQAFLSAFYAANRNAAEAYRSAYGREIAGAKQLASILMKNANVKAIMEEVATIEGTRFGVSEDKITAAYAQMAFSDVRGFFDDTGKLIPITELPRELANMIVSFEVHEINSGPVDAEGNHTIVTVYKSYKLINRKDVLDSLAKTQGMFISEKKKPGEKAVAEVIRFPASVKKEDWEKRHSH